MPVAIVIKVRFFARLRELAGTESEAVELPAGSSLADVYAAVRRSHPGLAAASEAVRGAVNQEFSDWGTPLADGDEVAFIPPVSGGGSDVGVLFEVTDQPLDARRLEAAVSHPGAGAVCTFTGVVRDNSRGRDVAHLDYEAYAGMAVAQMRKIGDEVAARWPEARIAIAHRTGRLEIGEPSVVVSVSCPHRGEAIAACKWGIDRLKESVPIWKKEHAADGTFWIEGAEARPAEA